MTGEILAGTRSRLLGLTLDKALELSGADNTKIIYMDARWIKDGLWRVVKHEKADGKHLLTVSLFHCLEEADASAVRE